MLLWSPSPRALTGRERAYTIHNYEVNIHATPSSLVEGVASGSSKVRQGGEGMEGGPC